MKLFLAPPLPPTEKKGKNRRGGLLDTETKVSFLLSSSRFPLKNEKAQKESSSNDDDPHLLFSPRCEETIKKGREREKKSFFFFFAADGWTSLAFGGGGTKALYSFLLFFFPLLPLPLSTKCATDFLALVSPTFCENLFIFYDFFVGKGFA